MNYQEILEKLKNKINIIEAKEDLGILNATIDKKSIRDAVIYLKNELNFDHLNFLTAIDWIANSQIEVIYRFYSYQTKDKVVLRVKLERTIPEIETISDLFKTANWHEREVYEMFGVKFLNHSDLRKLLLPDGIEMPLRKDFTCEDFEKKPEF
jgi:NADH:ubiquinone oxidoreductase subunit C